MIEQIISYIIITTIYAFSLVMNKSLRGTFIKIYAREGEPVLMLSLLKCSTHSLTVLTFTVWSPLNFSKHWWVGVIFSTLRNSMAQFSSYIFPCQTPVCQTASLLQLVTWQQNGMEYLWEDSATNALPLSTPSAPI